MQIITKFRFDSRVLVDEQRPLGGWTQHQIKAEPMLFRCDYAHAIQFGGPLTLKFLSLLNSDIISRPDFTVDSRVHMLMPGWYPCIPGFHHDDIERGPDGQPNYRNLEHRSQHVMCLANGEIAPTEFALGVSEFDDVEPGEVYYREWHPEVERQLATGQLTRFSVPSGVPIYFDCFAWHQGVKAISKGFRWFIRGTWNSGRSPANELRRNANVYLDRPMDGW